MSRIAKETALPLRTAVPPLMIEQRTVEQRWWSGLSPMEEQAWRKGGCLTAPPEAVTGNWESRQAFVREPCCVPPKVTIEDRETAEQTHETIYMGIPTPLIIYTDGSGYQR
ncbi:hypothetical protein NUU61_008035 [Penicillium alfredii]|uniref:Uncharacterized protein n=1 Tax=Penicillium alfredii TaxID=1506179 RepID=A0A9W9JYW1_9EURO|nr:uncharacterized protein NUU61_008035 [Penicillium alfredii]KAJ5086728.1 hypothetical protein NUU61_008035 [Penicillium alfredii]